MNPDLNEAYVKKALTFHGQPLQKIWLSERSEVEFQKLGIDVNTQDYSVYQERQKFFTFRDRAKRLKLHQFLTKKANDLYPNELKPRSCTIRSENIFKATKNQDLAVFPPYEYFLCKKNPLKRRELILSTVQPGDIVYALVKDVKVPFMTVKPLCTEEPLVRLLNDLEMKITVQKPVKHSGPHITLNRAQSSELGGSHEGTKSKQFKINDYVRCEVAAVIANIGHMSLTITNKESHAELGLVEAKDLPNYYKISSQNKYQRFKHFLEQSNEFLNPNYDDLFTMNGLDVNENFSLLTNLKCDYPRSDFARELRLNQANSWAMKSVAAGIECIKDERHMEAFQHLNKALVIDPMNVEGLVARGALFANRGSFLKGVKDFEMALSYDMYHPNARKYLGDTLVALGSSYEDTQRYDDAMKAYKKCLDVIPSHRDALDKYAALNNRLCNNLAGNERLGLAMPEQIQNRPSVITSTEIVISSSSDSSSSLNPGNQQPVYDLQKEKADVGIPEKVDYNKAFFSLETELEPLPLPPPPSKDSEKEKPTKKHKEKRKKSKKSKKKSVESEDETKDTDSFDFEKPTKAECAEHHQLPHEANYQGNQTNWQPHFNSHHEQPPLQQFQGMSQNHCQPQPQPETQEHLLYNPEDIFLNSESPPPAPKISLNNYPSAPYYEENQAKYRAGNSPLNSGQRQASSKNSSSPKMIDLGLNQRPRYENKPLASSSSSSAKPKLSFQLKKLENNTNFNLTRTAPVFQRREPSQTPNSTKSRSISRERERERERETDRSHHQSSFRGRSRSVSVDRRRRSRTVTRSRSRSYSRRSRSYDRYRSRSRRDRSRSSHKRRRRRSRSRSYSKSSSRSRSPSHSSQYHNRRSYYKRYSDVRFRRDSSRSPPRRRSRSLSYDNKPSTSKYASKSNESKLNLSHEDFQKQDDGLLIQEIDEIIKKAQKVRKEKIIKHDKSILKQTPRRI